MAVALVPSPPFEGLMSGTSSGFPYRWEVLPFEKLFVDKTYQRPLTNFRHKVRKNFDPVLFQVLAVSERSNGKFAIIDGQTRWWVAVELGITAGPCLVYEGLTRPAEASIFERLQTQRKGMTSWHRFRAALIAGNPEAKSIMALATACGYQLGHGQGEMRSPAALEACYRLNPVWLERTLIATKAAWPEEIPKGSIIRGIHRWFTDREMANKDPDDEKLIRRLSIVGTRDLVTRAMHIASGQGHGGSSGVAKYIAQAVEVEYSKRS